MVSIPLECYCMVTVSSLSALMHRLEVTGSLLCGMYHWICIQCHVNKVGRIYHLTRWDMGQRWSLHGLGPLIKVPLFNLPCQLWRTLDGSCTSMWVTKALLWLPFPLSWSQYLESGTYACLWITVLSVVVIGTTSTSHLQMLGRGSSWIYQASACHDRDSYWFMCSDYTDAGCSLVARVHSEGSNRVIQAMCWSQVQVLGVVPASKYSWH